MYKTKILFVEDEVLLANNLKKILEFEDFEVTTAINGTEAFELARKNKPDLVISDIMMPGMNGYEFFTAFKKLGYDDVPFIYLTAKADFRDIRSGMNSGADDYLVKPIKATDLIDAINTRLKREKAIKRNLEETNKRLNKGFKLLTNHEFNTPMNGLMGFVHLLKSNRNNIGPEEMNRYIDYIDASANRLNKLFEKLRLWDEFINTADNNGPLKLSDFISLNQTLQEVAEKTAARYDRSNDLHVTLNNTGDLKLDGYITETLLNELIDNAFKFSEKGTDVMVSGSVKDNMYIVKISDEGHKIKAEALADIHAFKQNDRNLFEQQGLGIGLCLADTIVKKLKGQLNFSDNQPNGILVTLQLPVET